MLNDSITLKLYGKKITSDNLIQSIKSFYGFIDDITLQIFNEKNIIKWIVNVEKGSFALRSSAEYVKELDINKKNEFFNSIQKGINILGKEAKYPSFYNDSALEKLKELALLPNKQNGLTKITIIVNDKENILTHKIITNIDMLLNVYSQSMSSITGRLSTLTERKGLKIIVYNDRTGKAVDCIIDEEFLKDAIDAFGKRVYIYGLMNYFSSGRPKSIKVKKIEKFKDESQLPNILETHGILKGIV